jgi:hypothetical protein
MIHAAGFWQSRHSVASRIWEKSSGGGGDAPPDILALRIAKTDLLGWDGRDLAAASKSKRQLHILQPPPLDKIECPVDHLKIERQPGITRPSVWTLKIEPG